MCSADCVRQTQSFEGLLVRCGEQKRHGRWCELPGNHHTPRTNRKRTRCAYAAYLGSSACSVRSSQTVRSTSTSEPKPAGINAHQEPSDNAMPTKRRTAAK